MSSSLHNLRRMTSVIGLSALATVLSGCDVDQTREAKMPDVDVDVSMEEGQLPKYEVETADVDIGSKDVKVKVPDVDVSMKEKSFSVPDVDVDMPDDE